MIKVYSLYVTKRIKLIEAISRFFSKRQAKRIVDEGLCSVNSQKELRYRRELKPGDTVRFVYNPYLFEKEDIEILYEDNYLYAVLKPPFINTNVDFPNLEDILSKRFGKNCFAVHRLDKHTSGVLLFAKSKEIFEAFKEIFTKRKVEKRYLAVVQGTFKGEKRITFPLDGREAITVCREIKVFEEASLVEVKIETGRKHQIRRHLSAIGYPVAGEFLHWKKGWREKKLLFAPRILLHAESIEFPHPAKGNRIKVKTPPIKDFAEFLQFLEGGKLSIVEEVIR